MYWTLRDEGIVATTRIERMVFLETLRGEKDGASRFAMRRR